MVTSICVFSLGFNHFLPISQSQAVSQSPPLSPLHHITPTTAVIGLHSLRWWSAPVAPSLASWVGYHAEHLWAMASENPTKVGKLSFHQCDPTKYSPITGSHGPPTTPLPPERSDRWEGFLWLLSQLLTSLFYQCHYYHLKMMACLSVVTHFTFLDFSILTCQRQANQSSLSVVTNPHSGTVCHWQHWSSLTQAQ